MALATIVVPASADDYRLDTQDRVRIRVVEWRTIEGNFREWGAVSGEYTVGPAGTLSLPFIGETEAAGKTTAEIAQVVGATLQQKFGLADKPEASVELAQYRPFYISGDVESPGQYPYVPDLNVLKAVSIAGGLERANGQRVERDFLNAKGSYDVLAAERLRLLVKRARLAAEAQGKTEFAPPQGLPAGPKLDEVMADEAAIMAARQGRLKRQLETLDSLKGLLESEIESLQQKTATQNRQVDLARQELSGLGNLSEKGLVVNTRILTTERTIADLEGRLLDLDTAILQAKQDINKATQDAVNLQSSAEAELAIERQQVEADLTEAELKMEMQKGLITEALSLAPGAALSSDDARVEFVLVRKSGGKQDEMAADDGTPVLPGDIVKVKVMSRPETTSSTGQ
jgi:exopolysaccharide production protein ExoF